MIVNFGKRYVLIPLNNHLRLRKNKCCIVMDFLQWVETNSKAYPPESGML